MFKHIWKGFLLCAGLATVATITAPFLGKAVSPLLLAIIFGLILGNTIYQKISTVCAGGVGIAKKQVLRTAIVLYGFKLTFHDVAVVGWSGFFVDTLMLFSTFLFALWLGRRVFKLDRDTSILIGAGASICGAAAVLATEPVLKAKSYKVSVAVATVVVFGTLGMFLYPLIYSLHFLPFTPEQFGIYIGSSVHEVAQVVAAGGAISVDTANTAVISKMTRVMMLAPFLLWLSYMIMLANGRSTSQTKKIVIPWFAVGFIVMVGVNSYLPVGFAPVVKMLVHIDNFLLAVAMAALGLTTHFSEIRRVGAAPFQLSLCIFAWLVCGGALVNWILL